MKKEHNLSILGTVNKRRRFLPNELLPSKEREVLSTRFGFSNNISICSYVPKKNKAVIVLSTSHYNIDVVPEKKNKPQMILDYNKTKGGTDTMDKMLSEYSCQRKTNRWPLTFFYNMIDVAALNAFIIHKQNNQVTPVMVRRKLLKDLALNLCLPEIERRSNDVNVNRIFTTISAIENILGRKIKAIIPRTPSDINSTVYKKCTICLRDKKRRTTRSLCMYCRSPVCLDHQQSKIIVCTECNLDNNE